MQTQAQPAHGRRGNVYEKDGQRAEQVGGGARRSLLVLESGGVVVVQREKRADQHIGEPRGWSLVQAAPAPAPVERRLVLDEAEAREALLPAGTLWRLIPWEVFPSAEFPWLLSFRKRAGSSTLHHATEGGMGEHHCPFARKGNLLWVAESHAVVPRYVGGTVASAHPSCAYRHKSSWTKEHLDTRWPWQSGAKMPREAAQSVLRVTGVCAVQKLDGTWWWAIDWTRLPPPPVVPSYEESKAAKQAALEEDTLQKARAGRTSRTLKGGAS